MRLAEETYVLHPATQKQDPPSLCPPSPLPPRLSGRVRLSPSLQDLCPSRVRSRSTYPRDSQRTSDKETYRATPLSS